MTRFLAAGIVAARGLHAPPPLATHGSTRHRENKPKIGGLQRPPPLFLSLPAVRTTSPAKPNKHHIQLILIFISFLSSKSASAFILFFFKSAPFLCLLPSRFQAGRFVMGLSSSPLLRVEGRWLVEIRIGL